MLLLWIRGVLAHRQLRVAGAAAGVALATALLVSMVLFLLNASASMTARAISTVPVDWQVQVIPGADANAIGKALAETSRVKAVHRVQFADIDGFQAQTGGTTQTTGPGQVIAFDGDYASDFPA